jgi:type II secretory pathway component PulL
MCILPAAICCTLLQSSSKHVSTSWGTHHDPVLFPVESCWCILRQCDGEDGGAALMHTTEVHHLWGKHTARQLVLTAGVGVRRDPCAAACAQRTVAQHAPQPQIVHAALLWQSTRLDRYC